MSKKRKLHQLTGQIKAAWPGQVKTKSQYRGSTFYCLEIMVHSLFNPTKQTIYAFPNLVSKEILKVLESQTYHHQKYLFTYEKRTRGWRLKEMEEIKEELEDYSFPPPEELIRIRKKLSDPKYEGGNIALPKDAEPIEKVKYSISQSILTYHQETKKSFAKIVQEITLADITEKKVYDLCRGKISDFTLGELVVSALNLRIYSIPCLDCGRDILPILLGDIVHSLKKQENLPTKIPNIYQALEKHQTVAHC